jgi:hypothetical protein
VVISGHLVEVVREHLHIKPLKPKLAYVFVIFKNSGRTAKETQRVSITKISWLMLHLEIIPVYSEDHTKPIYPIQNAELLIVKVNDTFLPLTLNWII